MLIHVRRAVEKHHAGIHRLTPVCVGALPGGCPHTRPAGPGHPAPRSRSRGHPCGLGAPDRAADTTHPSRLGCESAALREPRVSVEASEMVSIPRAELDALKAELRRLPRE